MTIKTALMTTVAAAFLTAAPAMAQDTAAQAAQQPAPASAQAAQPQSVTLTPGSSVRGPDGELGKLEGVREVESGQELTVRGADGALRGVPLGGLTQEGDAVMVAFTKAEFDMTPPIAGAEPAAPVQPAAEPAPTSTPDAGHISTDQGGDESGGKTVDSQALTPSPEA